MIETKNLSAGYYGRAVIGDVSLDFLPGQVLVLLGPNGCGKSTLLKAALGLLPPMRGTVLYDGADIRSLSQRQIAQQAALLTQSRSTPSIQALRMVLHGRFPYLSYPRRYSKRDRDIARAAMQAAGCDALEHENVSELSGGQRQAVYLAMALAQDTQTVFMDEPTTFLDVRRQIQTMQTARHLAGEGKAVVAVLHDIALALRSADRIAVMLEGRLLQCAAPEDVLRSGALKRAFGVQVHCADTPHGKQYYCVAED